MLGKGSNNLRDEHPECLEIWHDLASCSEHHLMKAMLNDLLWLLRYNERQKAHIYARSAIAHYLRFFDELLNLQVEHRDMRQHDLLCRAAELTKTLGAREEYHGIAERCEVMFGDARGENSYWAIRAAACLPTVYRPADLDNRIESLHSSYAARSDRETWPLSESLYDIQFAMAEQDRDIGRLRQIRASASRLLIEEAKGADSDLRAGRFLQEAEERAQGAEEESVLIGEIREVRSNLAYDGEFHEISSDLSVPTEAIQRITNVVQTAESMSDALDLTMAYSLKWLGAIGAIEREAAKAYDGTRLVNLFSRVHITHDNIECCRPDSDDAKRRRAIAERFRLQALSAATLITFPCLAAIGERPELERGTLREYMVGSASIGDVEADAFVRAFEFYWAQDYDSAVHVALPRIESSLRNLARNTGIEISFPPQGDECGGLRGLNRILDDLHDEIGESNARMLSYLLVDTHAMNLRDNCAHGVPSENPRGDAALVLWIVLWLSGLR